MQDFFFGELYETQDGALSLSLNTLLDLRGQASDTDIMEQINRILQSAPGNQLTLDDTTSSPRFWSLLEIIHQQVVKIEVFARTDVNPAVKATLSADITMKTGILHIDAHWSGYKSTRADEVVGGLIAPIFQYGLQEKLRTKRKGATSLVTPELALSAIAQESGYARSFTSDHLKTIEDASCTAA